MKKLLIPVLFIFMSCTQAKKDHQEIVVKKTTSSPNIDGKATEHFWSLAEWHPLDQNWIGEAYDFEDFNGRYKLAWSENGLYLFVEIVDDILLDQHSDPLTLWWDDDCVEVFVDADNSGGEHQYNHNAFAYHVALDKNVVDLAPDKKPHLYNDHVTSTRITEGNTSSWELHVKIFNDDYIDGQKNTPQKLKANEKIGFALAYCDNDNSTERENFIGSVFVPGENKNQGWINANIFGTLLLEY